MGCMSLWLFIPCQAKAQTNIETYFDYGEVNAVLDDIFPESKASFSELVTEIIEGESIGKTLWYYIKQQASYEFRSVKKSMVQIFLIALVAAVFRNFSGVFQNQQAAELGFYVLYMLFITICVGVFQVLVESVESAVTHLLDFFRAMGPVYFMGVAITTGNATSIAFYNILLFIIYLMDVLVKNVLLPLIQTYFVLRVLNELSKEDYLTKFGELIEMLVKWVLRGLLAGVVGIGMIQGMLTPAIDSVKRSVITGGGEALPIIGDAVGGVTEVVLGTAVLIRNGIGAAGAAVCVAICAVPVIKMAGIVVLYRLTAAVIQPISEKRMVNCVGTMADGAGLLLHMIVTSGALFLIVIAIVTNST